ncbi:hypothetical protein RYX41_17240 [Lactiplantibacillus plantarum]|nr:hypothetical protein [Lactiplantibacillus plantarum]
MSQNEELAKQILTAYANGQVDLTNVPDLQKWSKKRPLNKWHIPTARLISTPSRKKP